MPPKNTATLKTQEIKSSQKNSLFFGVDQKDNRYEQIKLIANHILKNEIDTAVLMVKNRAFFDCTVIAEDTMKRTVKGKLIEIAAMAGVSHKDIERLGEAGKLSKEEIDKQLEVITSPEAIEANNQRNLVAINALKIFAVEISKIKDVSKNKDKYGEALKKFRQTLHFRGIITSGYIFDRQIMIDALDFFQQSPIMQKMSSHQIDVIEECGIKMIKLMLCAADQPPFTVVTINELEEHFKPDIEKRNAACCLIM